MQNPYLHDMASQKKTTTQNAEDPAKISSYVCQVPSRRYAMLHDRSDLHKILPLFSGLFVKYPRVKRSADPKRN